MKRILCAAILISAFCFAVFGQNGDRSNVPIVDPDVFGKMTWKEEKTRLDNFANQLNENEDKIGFIIIDFGQNTTEAKKSNRLNRITSYLVKTKKIEKNRFNLVTASVYDTETTKYLIIDKSKIPEK